jgi:alpha-tubulin suppressor-like RCC1 family protein
MRSVRPYFAALLVAVAVAGFAGCKGRFALPADARFVKEIALADRFGCSAMKDGSVRCWGANEAGELGDGTREARPTSVRVTGVASPVRGVALGDVDGCGLGPEGEVQCWGALPAPTPPALRAKALALGARHGCALTVAGDVLCWGAADAGQLGTTEAGKPVVREATAIAASVDATCALLRDRGVSCWGRVPGRGVVSPSRIEGLADVTALAVSGTHACAVRAWGGVACWGKNEEGELGDGTFTDRAAPVDVVDLAVPAREVAVGRGHSCALLRDGTVHCWGANGRAQLADGTTGHRPSPVLVNGIFEVEGIAAAGDATCARLADGSERCWGGIALPKTAGATMAVPTEVRW